MKRDIFQAIADPTRRAILVLIEIKCDELSDLEKIIEMGFKEGFTAALENPDELVNPT